MDPQQGPPQPDLLIGQTIGNYLVTQKLGEGGMGSVYLAEHPAIGKKVALKVLHSEFSNNQEVAARFFHEAKAVNDIGHPNIVDIVDFGIIQSGGGRDQLVYFIMEYLAGVTLSHLIKAESPLPPERALSIALQVADALSASHKCGIVHRDLKPDNIILLQRGRERDFVKLLDFGIAKLTGGSAMGSHRTRTGIVMGTPAYMSPEQCEGRDSLDLRTDVYALGILIYEMLTGRVPFLGEGYGEILVQHLTQRPIPPSQFRILSPHVEVVVMKALEKRPDMRYPTMEEFMRAMSDAVGYVEAHGGVGGFLQRPLTPSSAPLPSVRLLPSPLTPLPGTLIAPGYATPAPTTPGYATPAPTTLSSAAAHSHTMPPAGSKVGYVVAGAAVVLAAVVGIVVAVSKNKVVAAGPRDAGSDATQVATNPPQVIDAALAPDAPALGSAGGGTLPPIDARGADAAAMTVEASAEIDVISSPIGAKIYVDNVDSGKVTPFTLTFSKTEAKRIAISLKLKGYSTYTFKPVEASESSQQKAELVKLKAVSNLPGPGSGAKNGSGTKTGSSSGSDRDGLMRPE
jgi:eukaryotic-like serine/threonine-protein kinase